MKQIIYFFIPAFCLYLLISFCTLSFIIPFNFITSDNGWVMFFRIIIFIVHMVWAYILYKNYNEELLIKKAKNYNEGFKLFEGYNYDVFEYVIGPKLDFYYRNKNQIEYAQLDENTFLIKKA